MTYDPIRTDTWVWGREKIVWGYDTSHAYTLKILEPKPGRAGCLSLQYHNEKSETWIVSRGVAWALVVVGEMVCTRLMKSGDIQTLPFGTIHRLMGVTDDVQVLEPSTPDRHAADKSVPKDVIRLHCVLGRPCDKPRDDKQAEIVKWSVDATEEAIRCIEEGRDPPQYNIERLRGNGYHHVNV